MKKKALYNIFFTIMAQFTAILSAMIIPRLILSELGSEVNGLITSITQFLNYVTLIEGGLGSVVLSALYKPLAEKNDEKLSSVIVTAGSFFKKIGWFIIGYGIVVGIIYPHIVHTSFSTSYVFSLILIIGAGFFVQYFFSFTYKLLLQADQRMYIVQIVDIVSSLLSLVIIYVLIKRFPSIHLIKLFSALVFMVHPIFYSRYIKKNYNVKKNAKPDIKTLSQRWDCFGQNLAFFVHSNTDVVLLSLFTNLKLVSVYSVYLTVVNGIKNLMMSLSNAFTPILGRTLAEKDIKRTNYFLDLYEFTAFNLGTIIFGSAIYLLPDFILLYTTGIKDVDYYTPVFSTLLVISSLIYIIRDPYMEVVYCAGHFKQTAKGAYIEAGLNVMISLLLVSRYGLIGIVLGTCISMFYRLIYIVNYINKHIIHRSWNKFLKRMVIAFLVEVVSLSVIRIFDSTGSPTALLWIKNGLLSCIIFTLVTLMINMILDNGNTRKVMHAVYHRFNR